MTTSCLTKSPGGCTENYVTVLQSKSQIVDKRVIRREWNVSSPWEEEEEQEEELDREDWLRDWKKTKRGGVSRWLRTGFWGKIGRSLPVLSCMQLFSTSSTSTLWTEADSSLSRDIWAALKVRMFFFFFLFAYSPLYFTALYLSHFTDLSWFPQARWGMHVCLCVFVQLGVPVSVSAWGRKWRETPHGMKKSKPMIVPRSWC